MSLTLQQKIRSNWKSGLTVGLVSIPIAISLAVASNASPVAGIVTAFWAGLIASIFGGSNYNIIGPTGALSGLLFTYGNLYGSDSLPMLAIMAGFLIFGAYFFNVQKYLIFIPGSALHGFILGIAIMIVLMQINPAFGLPPVAGHHGLLGNAFDSLCNIGLISLPTFILFCTIFTGLMLFARLTPRLPGTIVLTPCGILFGYLCVRGILPWHVQTLGEKYAGIAPTLALLPTFHFRFAYLIPAFSVALIAILETMISAKIADGVTLTKHNKRKEMVGLGLANIVSGMAGGIPATAALARTALNIRSGSTDKMSATISSICIAVIALLLITYFHYLPLAVVAAILVFVAFRMVEAEHFWRMIKVDRYGFGLSMIVAFVTIYQDPMVGILSGAVVGMLLFMEKISTGSYETMHQKKVRVHEPLPETEPDILVYSVKGPLAYINAQAHIARLENIQPIYTDVILDLGDVYFIDLDGVEAFGEIILMLIAKQKRVAVTGLHSATKHLLQESSEFNRLDQNGHVFDTVGTALEHVRAQRE